MLRDLLRSLSSFIGDGAGGLLPKLGWDLNDFNSFLNKSETDSAWESYQRHKQQKAADAAATGSQPSTGQKRPQDDDSLPGSSKRPRGPNEQNGDRERADSFSNPMMVPLPSAGPSVPQNGMFSASARSHDAGLLNEIFRGTGIPASSPPASGSFGSPSQGMGNSFPNSFVGSGIGVHNDTGMPSMSMVGTSPVPVPQQRVDPTPPAVPEEDDVDSKKADAYKLVQYVLYALSPVPVHVAKLYLHSYHLDNYKRNSAYCLPSSLRPTLVQRYVTTASLPNQSDDARPH